MSLGSLFAYVSPDIVLPIASMVAALIGGILLYARQVVGVLTSPFRLLGRRRKDAEVDQL